MFERFGTYFLLDRDSNTWPTYSRNNCANKFISFHLNKYVLCVYFVKLYLCLLFFISQVYGTRITRRSSVRVWCHSGLTGPFVPKRDSPKLNNKKILRRILIQGRGRHKHLCTYVRTALANIDLHNIISQQRIYSLRSRCSFLQNRHLFSWWMMRKYLID